MTNTLLQIVFILLSRSQVFLLSIRASDYAVSSMLLQTATLKSICNIYSMMPFATESELTTCCVPRLLQNLCRFIIIIPSRDEARIFRTAA